MKNLLEEIKARYSEANVSGDDAAIIYRADVGYLLSRLSDAENAIANIYANAKYAFERTRPGDQQ